MKNILLVLFILSFTLFSFGQKPEFTPRESIDGEIIFSPSMKRPIYWESKNDCCRTFVVDGVDYRRIIHQDKVIVLGITVFQQYYAVKVMIGNVSSKDDFLFDPSLVVLDHTKEKGAAVDYKLFKTNRAENPDKLANKIQSRAVWATALATMGTSISKPNNSTEQLRTDVNNIIIKERAATLSNIIRDAGFRRNTVFPESYVAGTVFIKKGKFQQGFFIVPIGEFEYCFAFGSFK